MLNIREAEVEDWVKEKVVELFTLDEEVADASEGVINSIYKGWPWD